MIWLTVQLARAFIRVLAMLALLNGRYILIFFTDGVSLTHSNVTTFLEGASFQTRPKPRLLTYYDILRADALALDQKRIAPDHAGGWVVR